MAGDAHHIAAPTEDGDGPSRAMLAAIGEGQIFRNSSAYENPSMISVQYLGMSKYVEHG